jgi:hypothetical protein
VRALAAAGRRVDALIADRLLPGRLRHTVAGVFLVTFRPGAGVET